MAAIALLLMAFLALSAAPAVPPSAPAARGVAFVWLFGFDGGTFLPSSELGLSQAAVVSLVSTLSADVGGPTHMDVVSAVTETPGESFTPSRIMAAREFVLQLRDYAGVVFGRIPLDLYNMTSLQSIYSEVGKYQNQLGVNGILLDKSLEYYLAVGQANFNAMMQRLTDLYPRLVFILNQRVSPVAITPLPGTNWANSVIISPTVSLGTDTGISHALMKTVYASFGGRVLLHLDANPAISSEPMNVFGEQGPSAQASVVTLLAGEGLHPLTPDQGFNFLFPVLGAATCACALPPAELYNSLSYGLNPRGTLGAFLPLMEAEAAA